MNSHAYPQQAMGWSSGGYEGSEPASSGKSLSFGMVWRAIRRHWWQAAILWVIGSGSLMTMAFMKIKPTYVSFALLRVEPPRASVLGPSLTTQNSGQIKRTHMQLIKAPDVLSDAVSEYPEITQFPELKDTASPEFVIDKKLNVIDRLDSELIEVQMVASTPQNATDIVNAVVRCYIKQAGRWATETTTTQINKLTRELERRQKEVEDLRKNIQLLGSELGAVDPDIIKDHSRVNLEDYARMSQTLSQVEFDRISAESRVERLKAEIAQPSVISHRQNLAEATYAAFYADADVAELADQLDALKAQMERVDKLSRGQDSVERNLQERISSIKARIKALWERRRPVIEKQLAQQGAGNTTSTLDMELREAENQYQDLLVREQNLRKKMNESKLNLENGEAKELQLAFRRTDLTHAESILDSVQRVLEQLQFESQGQSQITLIQAARPIGLASNDKRWRFMAMAPFGVFVAVAALCLLVEMQSGRVSNPDDLSQRARLEILAVVPPLPNPRAARKLMGGINEDRLRRQLAEYIQSIDHLRVALCSQNTGDTIRQSVMVTSAFGGEGKTTLSAQLAGRCANAGLSTVVVDGDLRNPSLTRTLEALDQPGMINILKGEKTIEDCLVRIGEGGGFHLLPAGIGQGDPSRILEGSRVGKLVAQLRENFEIVIIDTSPVLPVPDALMLGRWVQGIIIAVRYDTSRFQMVQRAYKRLSTLKVPVLGAVVNGVRSASSTYGGYGYGYGYGYNSHDYTNHDYNTSPTDGDPVNDDIKPASINVDAEIR